MNVFARCCALVAFLALLLEIIEMGEAYRPRRPYKYYQRRPWNRPRWHSGYRSSKFYQPKRIPSDDYYSRRPGYYRPAFDDYEEVGQEVQPYSIVIQLAKGKHVLDNYGKRKRTYERVTMPFYGGESDYIDDEDDTDSRLFKINDKKVQIKMVKGENPQLQIKISRSDDERNIKFVDQSRLSSTDATLLPKIHSTLTSLHSSVQTCTTTPPLVVNSLTGVDERPPGNYI